MRCKHYWWKTFVINSWYKPISIMQHLQIKKQILFCFTYHALYLVQLLKRHAAYTIHRNPQTENNYGQVTWVGGNLSYDLLSTHIQKRTTLFHYLQWRSHWGGKGGRVPPWQRKICQKLGKNQEKPGKKKKNREEKAKIGKVLSLCPSWQIGLATLLTTCQWQHFSEKGHFFHLNHIKGVLFWAVLYNSWQLGPTWLCNYSIKGANRRLTES